MCLVLERASLSSNSFTPQESVKVEELEKPQQWSAMDHKSGRKKEFALLD